MTKEIIIVALLIALIYLYYQNRKKSNSLNFAGTEGIGSEGKEFAEDLGKNIQTIQTFLQTNLNSNSLEELKTKMGKKSLDEILEENEDYETEVDTLTRTKNSLEQDLLAQGNAFQNRLREKDREIKKLKEDLKDLEKVREKLTSEKQQHKGSIERISKLTEQITSLEKEKKELEKKIKKMPGEFPEEASSITSEEIINQPRLEEFIEWVKDYEEFDKVDWSYYRSQKDWQKSFRNWNKLRNDRISLLEKWKEENK